MLMLTKRERERERERERNSFLLACKINDERINTSSPARRSFSPDFPFFFQIFFSTLFDTFLSRTFPHWRRESSLLSSLLFSPGGEEKRERG